MVDNRGTGSGAAVCRHPGLPAGAATVAKPRTLVRAARPGRVRRRDGRPVDVLLVDTGRVPAADAERAIGSGGVRRAPALWSTSTTTCSPTTRCTRLVGQGYDRRRVWPPCGRCSDVADTVIVSTALPGAISSGPRTAARVQRRSQRARPTPVVHGPAGRVDPATWTPRRCGCSTWAARPTPVTSRCSTALPAALAGPAGPPRDARAGRGHRRATCRPAPDAWCRTSPTTRASCGGCGAIGGAGTPPSRRWRTRPSTRPRAISSCSSTPRWAFRGCVAERAVRRDAGGAGAARHDDQ